MFPREFNNRLMFFLDDALPLSVINSGANIAEFVCGHSLPLTRAAENNPLNFIRAPGDFARQWNNEIRVIVFLVVFKCAFIFHLKSEFFKIRNQFLFESESGMIRAHKYLSAKGGPASGEHTLFIHV